MAVAGGGYVGLTVALSIRQAAPHIPVMVVDAAPADAAEKDGRASAIAAAACRMLDQIGVWKHIEEGAQPINEMIVTDSRLQDSTRPVFLTFAEDAATVPPRQPFAHMIQNRDLVRVLRRRCLETGVELVHGESVASFEVVDAAMHFALSREKKAALACLLQPMACVRPCGMLPASEQSTGRMTRPA